MKEESFCYIKGILEGKKGVRKWSQTILNRKVKKKHYKSNLKSKKVVFIYVMRPELVVRGGWLSDLFDTIAKEGLVY